MTANIFIDGESGTTGLGIQARLEAIPQINLAELPPSERKNPAAKAAILRSVDLAILCLPNAAPRKASRSSTASAMPRRAFSTPRLRTASRPAGSMAFRSLPPGRQTRSERASASPIPAAMRPAPWRSCVRSSMRGLIPADFPVTINAVSGYTGGGKTMIVDL